MGMVATVGLGALITVSGVGPVVALVASVGGGVLIAYHENKAKEYFLG